MKSPWNGLVAPLSNTYDRLGDRVADGDVVLLGGNRNGVWVRWPYSADVGGSPRVQDQSKVTQAYLCELAGRLRGHDVDPCAVAKSSSGQ